MGAGQCGDCEPDSPDRAGGVHVSPLLAGGGQRSLPHLRGEYHHKLTTKHYYDRF